MQLGQRQVKGATVVDLSGDGIGSEPSPLRALITSILANGPRHLVLNLEHLEKMDSTCLAEIVASYKATVAAGGIIKMASANSHVRRVLQVTKVDMFVNVYESESDAVGSFGVAESSTHS
ncbi:MAG TPA: STAS domain-containing protein [Vicinamibacterales bacterium]|nr:STAS domain-containing protein [Vicinamibacterales bacterium]